MVYRIVQLHDGEVEVQSTPGRGTTIQADVSAGLTHGSTALKSDEHDEEARCTRRRCVWPALAAGCMTTRAADTDRTAGAGCAAGAAARRRGCARAGAAARAGRADLPPDDTVTPPPTKPRQTSRLAISTRKPRSPSRRSRNRRRSSRHPRSRRPPAPDSGHRRRRHGRSPVRDVIQSAQGILNNIDYRRLKPEQQSAYEQAKDSIDRR